MKILVIGSGGREHALAYKLSEEHEVVCAPGNPGMAKDLETVPISPSETGRLIELCRARGIELVVVGPEDPLIAGIADRMREAGIPTYGPGAGAARLEGSKAFSKELMRKANVPTAGFQTFHDLNLALEFARESYGKGIQLAVKASGAALGRGVTVCDSFLAAEEALQRMMVEKAFGDAGTTVVLEERLVGREFSLLTLVGDHNTFHLPIAQDYKLAIDGDQGANTGGMGSFSPCAWASPQWVDQVDREMVQPILEAIRSEEGKAGFRGTLFTGVMVTPNGPMCLEYNVRFGDPETQTVMMRLGKGFGEALFAAATGASIPSLEILERSAVTVIVASRGYPGPFEKNMPISLGPTLPGTQLFFGGVASQNGVLVNSGGRVVGCSAIGHTVVEARNLAYEAAKRVSFEGAYYRSDIASGP